MEDLMHLGVLLLPEQEEPEEGEETVPVEPVGMEEPVVEVDVILTVLVRMSVLTQVM
jgi:hypothetical protein